MTSRPLNVHNFLNNGRILKIQKPTDSREPLVSKYCEKIATNSRLFADFAKFLETLRLNLITQIIFCNIERLRENLTFVALSKATNLSNKIKV